MITLSVAFVLAVLVIVRYRLGRLRMILPSVPLILLAATLLLSVFWSDVPLYSAERLRTYGPVLVVAWMVGSCLTRAEFRRIFTVLSLISVVVVAALIAGSPAARAASGADAEGWHAQYSKNGLGIMLAFWLLCLLVLARNRFGVVLMGLIVVLSIGNQSRTSQLAMMLTVAAVLGLAWQRAPANAFERRMRFRVLATGVTAAVGAAFLLRNYLFELAGKDPTLSLRTEIWQATLPEIAKAPFLGHGAFAFLEVDSDSPTRHMVARHFNLFVPPHAHNAALDLTGQIGLVGLVFFLVSAGVVLLRALRLPVGEVKDFALLFLAFIAVTGLVESMFLGPWLVVLVLLDGHLSPGARAAAPSGVLFRSAPGPSLGKVG